MTARMSMSRAAIAAILPTLLLAGCATWRMPESISGVSPSAYQQRKQQAVAQFDEHRAKAEFESALAAWDRNDLKTCDATLARLLGRKPDYRDARLLAADVCLARHDESGAAQHIGHVLDRYPDDPQVQYAMALLLDGTRRHDEAMPYYRRASELEPENELYCMSLASASEAAQQRNGSAAGCAVASKSATRLLPPPPGHFQATAEPSRTPASQSGGSTARASSRESAAPIKSAAYSDYADSTGPAACELAESSLRRGIKSLQEGSEEAAMVFFRDAMTASPGEPQVPITAATAALRANRPEVALQVLKAAETQHKGSAAFQRTLGITYYQLADYQSSQAAFRQALSLDKSSALSYFLMGCTLAKLGQRESAETNFRQAQTIDPRYTLRP
jgi:predicted Zn-dependent protease